MAFKTIVLSTATGDPADDQPRRVPVQKMRAPTRRAVKAAFSRRARREVALALRTARYDATGASAGQDALSALVTEARGWLAGCGWVPETMTDAQVIRLVHLNYYGGWPEFVTSDPDADAVSVMDALRGLYGTELARSVGYGA